MPPAPLACCFLLLLVLATATLCSSQSVNATFFIRPNNSTSCPATECLSLEEFAQESGQLVETYVTRNITLKFLSGVHYLSTRIILSNLESVTVYPLLPDCSVTVRCTKPASLVFYNITYVEMSQLLIDSCGMEVGRLGNSTIDVVITNQAKFNNLTVVNSRGSAIHVIDSSVMLNSTQISHCGFFDLSNKYVTYGGAVNAYNSNLVITGNTVLSYNSAYAGGAISIWHGNIYITGNTTFAHNAAGYGGGLSISSARCVMTSKGLLFINNTALRGGGAVNALDAPIVEFSGSFLYNNAMIGGAIVILNTTAVARGILLSGNHADFTGGGISLDLQSILHVQSEGSIFQSNTAPGGGAVFIENSDIIVDAVTTVINNSATKGGGCYLGGQSRFILRNEASLQFLDNRASYKGGAVYVEEGHECNFDGYCMFVVPMIRRYVQLQNNSAEVAGSILYGGNVYCIDILPYSYVYTFYNISNAAEESSSSVSSVASDPYLVCFCVSGRVKCNANTTEVRAYPGQQFNVSAVSVGQADGVVPSGVRAQLVPNSHATMGKFQSSQQTTTTCTNLTFTLYSKAKIEQIAVTAGYMLCFEASADLWRYVNVTLLECPQGFQLTGNPPYCGCNERLLQYTIDCTIDDQKIYRSNNFWVYYDNATQGLVLHPHCPFDYCVPPPNNFTLQYPDQLCHYNRTRLLCGQCQHGLSLALGTSRCLKCSNYYLVMLPAFAVAGFALVFILFVCRLTVAKGTINGLIFYANIVHSNRALLFSAGKTNILTVFIAWLNLDLGIEMCFYDGMDTYVRTWLQFVFPVYVWILCGCIVLVSRRSSRVSRVLGTNPVAVLGTLFLLSYTKLLRTAMATLAFTTLSYPHNHTRLVWLYDANIGYLQGKHIPLFVVGLATLLLCLPYTMLLLTSQWLRAWSNLRLFQWINNPRLKFLLDAYNAPYKPKHSYWTGLLLLSRLLLYLIYAVNVLGNTNVNLLATCITVAVLVVWMAISDQPYRSRLLGALECLFLLNVIILVVSTLYVQAVQGNQGAFAYTSTALSIAVFIAVVAFHICQQIRSTRLWKTFTTRTVNQMNEVEFSSEVDNDQTRLLRHVTHSEIVLPGYNDHSSNADTDSQEDSALESQPLLQNEMAYLPPQLIDSTDSCVSKGSCENLFMPHTDIELREPLLSVDT